MEFRAHDAVAVLAGMRALVAAHHREGFFSDGAHRFDILLLAQIQYRSHMQAADRGVGIPGAARAVLLEHLGQPRRIFGKIDQRHGAIFHEGNRFSLLLHRHHDVEAGGAHVGDRRLQRRIVHLDDAAPFRANFVEAETEIAHHGGELFQLAPVLGFAIVEFDQQDRLRFAADKGFQRRAEHRDLARKFQHGAVDQFDGDRFQFHQMLRGVHCLVERTEMAGADRTLAEQRRKLQLDARGERERAFRAEQDVREIVLRRIRGERIQIVAADAALNFGKARLDLVRLAQADIKQIRCKRSQRRIRRQIGQASRHGAEMRSCAVGQHCIDRQNVVAHGAVA